MSTFSLSLYMLILYSMSAALGKLEEIQGLYVGGEACESHKYIVLHFEHLLERGGQGLEVDSEPSVAGYADGVLATQCHHCASIVREWVHLN